MRTPLGRAGGIRQVEVLAADRNGPELRLRLGRGDYATACRQVAPPDRARSSVQRLSCAVITVETSISVNGS